MLNRQLVFNSHAKVQLGGFIINLMVAIAASSFLPVILGGILALWFSYLMMPVRGAALGPEELCSLHFARLFEQRLVDGNVIQPWEMSICENPKCEECGGTRRWADAKFKHELEQQKKEELLKRRLAQRYEENKRYQKVIRPRPIKTSYDIHSDKYIKPIVNFEYDESWERVDDCNPCNYPLDVHSDNW